MFDQNSDLAKKVDDMQLKLENLSDQNSKLLELLETAVATEGPIFGRRQTESSLSPIPTSHI